LLFLLQCFGYEVENASRLVMLLLFVILLCICSWCLCNTGKREAWI